LLSKKARESELALVYLGSGPEEKDLKTQSRKLGIDKYLSFEGSVGRKQVALWMNAASCLCLTSRTESMPNVLLEAYSSGLPVAACNVGDVSFWLSDHPDAGLIVPSDKGECIKSLPRAIERLLEGEKHPSKAYTRTWQDVAGEIITLIRVKAEQQEK
jgi:glycosyltransferase involved in cell wall biosynthesis